MSDELKIRRRSSFAIVCYRCNRDRTMDDLTVDGQSQPKCLGDQIVYVSREECPECTSRLLVVIELPDFEAQ